MMNLLTCDTGIIRHYLKLLDDLKSGVHDKKETWYAYMTYKFSLDNDNRVGTFVYKISQMDSNTCATCKSIPSCKSFLKRLVRRKDARDCSRIRNDYLTFSEQKEKLVKLQQVTRVKSPKSSKI